MLLTLKGEKCQYRGYPLAARHARSVPGMDLTGRWIRTIGIFFLFLPSPFPFTPVTARQSAAVVFGACLGFSAIQRSWFARVNALCNFSRKKARKVAAATSGPVFEKASVHPVYNNGRLT